MEQKGEASGGKLPRRPVQVLAQQVRIWRDRRGLSAQQLADRVSEVGGKLDRQAISKIETGGRGVQLEEWLHLAYALSVPPLLLFLPLGSDAEVAIAPEVSVHPDLAWQWISGEVGPMTSEGRSVRPDEWFVAQIPVSLHRHVRAALKALQAADTEVLTAGFSGNPERSARAHEEYLADLVAFAKVLDEMAQQGVTAPAVSGKYLRKMQELQLLQHPEAVPLVTSEGDDE